MQTSTSPTSVGFSDRVEVTIGKGQKVHVRTGLFLNNDFVPSKSGKKLPTVNPSTSEVIAEVYEAGKEDIDVAVSNARAAFSKWRLTTGTDRGRLLSRLADLVDAHSATLAAVETLDQGKVLRGSMGTVQSTSEVLRYFAGWADKVHGKVDLNNTKYFGYTRREPYGVTAGIIPWNYPLTMWAFKVAPAIACGNVIIIKTSEKTPLTGLLMCELVLKAGFPPGVIQVVSGYGMPAGQALIEHPHVLKVAFTGSGRTGRKILEASSKTNLKKVSLELGGKSPAIVFDDADVDMAVRVLSARMFFNNGQTCVASSRIYVQRGVAEAFTKKFAAAAGTVKVGDPFDDKVAQGPIVDDVQFDQVLRYIAAGKNEAKLLTGGNRVGTKGYFLEPTVFTDVPENSKIMSEEIFGPVTCVNVFDKEEDVIARANNTQYGLAAGIFTKDAARAHRVSAALEAGMVWVNCYLEIFATLPFGGYKESGLGREQGEEALHEWTQVKSILMKL